MENINDHEILKKDLDAKDRKIMKELFTDARVSFSIIAKRVGLSKESVNYRVKRLMKQGLMTGFNTVIDVKKIGWKIFFLYLRFRKIDLEKESVIIDELKNHSNVAQVLKCIGNHDVVVKVFVRNHVELDSIIKDLDGKYGENFDDHIAGILTDEVAVPLSFLYDGKGKAIYSLDAKSEQVEVNDVDLKILKELSNNARIPLTDLAVKIKCSRDLVKYRLKRLEQKNVIINYRPDVWPKKLGFNWYFVVLKIGQLTSELNKKLTHFLLNHPNVSYYYKTVGSSDVQIEFRIKTTIELNNILMELRGIVKNVLKQHDVLMIVHEYKYTYFPDCLMDKR